LHKRAGRNIVRKGTGAVRESARLVQEGTGVLRESSRAVREILRVVPESARVLQVSGRIVLEAMNAVIEGPSPVGKGLKGKPERRKASPYSSPRGIHRLGSPVPSHRATRH
jgi:hypothetical protein